MLFRSKELNMTYIHPVADSDVVAGQGTIGLEILEQLPEVEQIVVPLGGGGLVYGIAVALKSIKPTIRIVAVQPEGSPAYYRSIRENKIVHLEKISTIADGLACKTVEPFLLENIKQWVDEVVLVPEEMIKKAIKIHLLFGKLLVEGAGAVALAAVLAGLVKLKVETVLLASGANIDSSILINALESEI